MAIALTTVALIPKIHRMMDSHDALELRMLPGEGWCGVEVKRCGDNEGGEEAEATAGGKDLL